MRVLVTGAEGYVGSVLVPMLRAAGHDVVGLDTGLFAACGFGPQPDLAPVLPVDLRDVEPRHVAGFEAVCHLGAISNDPLGDLDPSITWEVNHAASTRLARLARDAGCRRFVYASTCSVYGAAGSDDLVTEDAPLAPVTPYAESKVRVEDELVALADDDFSPVSLRNATAYGVSPRLRADIVLNNLTGHAHLSGVVRVLSDGTPWRPLVHVADMAAAFVAALGAPRERVHGQAFNVGRAEDNLQVRDIAEVVARAVPGSRLDVTGETGGDPRSYRVDFSKVGRLLPEFVPAWTVPAGARELAAAYEAHGLTAADFTDRYTRLRWLAARREAGTLDDSMRPVAGPVSA